MSFKWFSVVLLFSVVIAVGYMLGHRRNLKFIKNIASIIESEISPVDAVYTWLGGVLGFTVTYSVEGFNKVIASFFALPRQSLLYLPIAYLTTGYDKLEILFYLKRNINNEIHVIKRNSIPGRMPAIYNKDQLISENVNINNCSFIVFYRNKDNMLKKILELMAVMDKGCFFHMTLTPDNNILYIRLNVRYNGLKTLSSTVKKINQFILNKT